MRMLMRAYHRFLLQQVHVRGRVARQLHGFFHPFERERRHPHTHMRTHVWHKLRSLQMRRVFACPLLSYGRQMCVCAAPWWAAVISRPRLCRLPLLRMVVLRQLALAEAPAAPLVLLVQALALALLLSPLLALVHSFLASVEGRVEGERPQRLHLLLVRLLVLLPCRTSAGMARGSYSCLSLVLATRRLRVSLVCRYCCTCLGISQQRSAVTGRALTRLDRWGPFLAVA